MKLKKIQVSIILATIFLAIISLAIVYSMYTNEKDNTKNETDRYIVRLKQGESFESFASKVSKHINSIKHLDNKQNGKVILITLSDKTDKTSFINQVKSGQANSYIEYIVPDDQVTVASSDSLFNQQWPIYTMASPQDYSTSDKYSSEIGVVPSWDITTGKGSVVAVLDSGIDISQENVAKNIWDNTDEITANQMDDDNNGYIDDNNGWNFFDKNNVVHDPTLSYDEWHGTSVSGIIAAAKDNDKGTTGVAPDAKIMPLKIFNYGVAYTSEIIEAINYASANGVKIANCSFGSNVYNDSLKDAMQNSNMLFVCAAGNSGNEITADRNQVYPAAFQLPNIISVAATDENGNLCKFSNYGSSMVDVAAPGQNILSTYPDNNYKTSNGTSMSAAFVSGEAALILSKNPDMTPEQIKQKICDTAVKLSSLTDKVKSGGLINCWNAVNNIIGSNIIQIDDTQDAGENNSYPNNPDSSYSLFATGTWSVCNPVTQGLSGHGTAVMGNYLYVAGGYNNGFLSTLYRYNGTSWSTLTSMPQARNYLTLSTVSTNLYAIGGQDSSYNPTSSTYQYNGTSWSSKDNMPTARYGHCAVEYKGKIYIFGGKGSGGSLLSSVQAFDPTQSSGSQWTTKTNMPIGRSNFAIAVVGSKIYCIGGVTSITANGVTIDVYNPDSNTWDVTRPANLPNLMINMAAATYNNSIYVAGNNDAYLHVSNVMIQYDPASSTWITKNSMQYARQDLSLTTYNGAIYAIGGYNYTSYLNYVEKFTEPPTNTNGWTSMTSLSQSSAVSNQGSVSLTGQIMIAGGRDSNNTILKTVRAANMAKGSWSLLPDMNTAREKLTLSLCNEYIYAIGGQNGSSAKSTVEKYDQTAKTWTTVTASMPTARYGHRAAVVNNKIYVIGGYNSSGTIVNTVEIYDPTTNTWDTGKPGMTTARADFGIGVVGNKIYVFGGNTSGGGTSSVEAFDTGTNTWSGRTSIPGATQKYTIATVGSNKIYIAGGRDISNNLLNTTYQYIPAADCWTQQTNMPSAKTDFTFNEVNGEMVAIGGNNGTITNELKRFRADNFAPGTTSSFSYTDTDTGVTLSSAGVFGATSYEFEVDGVIYSSPSTTYSHTYTGTIPVHAYRVRSVDSNGSGYWSTTIILSEMHKASISCTPGEAFNFMLTASDLDKFSGKTFTVRFDSTKFDVIDLYAETQANDLNTYGQIPGSNLTITSYSVVNNNLVIKFTSSETVPDGKTWSGVVDIIRLKPKTGITGTNYIYSSTNG